jgi:hypothetical protein
MASPLYQFSTPYHSYLKRHAWELWGTLPPPFKMSLGQIERAADRMNKLLQKKYVDYRLFWIAERFSSSGYHIHFALWVNAKGETATDKKISIEQAWQTSIGSSRKPNSKTTKYRKDGNALEYMLKEMYHRTIAYGFDGNAWLPHTK